jgi:acyl dehydratase
LRSLVLAEVDVGSSLPELNFDVTSTVVVAGALANRDYSQLHHDTRYAQEDAGHSTIFMNTQLQAAFFERYLFDWSGQKGRLGRMRFKMKRPVYAGSQIVIKGEVTGVLIDKKGCGWVTLKLTLNCSEEVASECEVRYALPVDVDDNPWSRGASDWLP